MILAASFDINDPSQWYNRALQYGDGLFETMRYHKTSVPLFRFHQTRMSNGLKQIGLADLPWVEIEKAIYEHANENQFDSRIYKLLAFRGGNERGYCSHIKQPEWLINSYDLKPINSTHVIKLGVANNRLAHQSHLAGMKHLSRLEQVLIANQLNESTRYHDLLVLDVKDRIIETTFQNVVLVKDDRLYSPKLKHCGVFGVALSWLSENYPVEFKNIKLKQLKNFDAVMVCNSIKGFSLASVHNSQDKAISCAISHPIHDKISNQWNSIFN